MQEMLKSFLSISSFEINACQWGDNAQKMSLNSPGILGSFLLEMEPNSFPSCYLAGCAADLKTIR